MMLSVIGRPPTQLQLLERERYPDRNHRHGGRSFYFFDFDDNVMSLATQTYLFHRESGRELELSTREFAQVSHLVGRPGPYEGYEVILDDATGSFRRFRDHPDLAPHEQPFVQDVRTALAHPDVAWRGPSWPLFEHAVHNDRPISIITARGHADATLRAGIDQLVQHGHLPAAPRYVSILGVSHPRLRQELGAGKAEPNIPELKMAAILRSVEIAMEQYGHNPHHRFGMSDDSPENLELVTRAMRVLKAKHPNNAFFVIDSSRLPLVKKEIFIDHHEEEEVPTVEQLRLFKDS